MDKELEKLTQLKEKAELFLSNLEKLKSEGSTSESQYSTLKSDYTKMYDNAVTKIDLINQAQQEKADDKQRKIKNLQEELDNIEARNKVGEVTERVYEKQVKSLKKKINRLDDNFIGVHKNWFEEHLNWTLVLFGFLVPISLYVITLFLSGKIFIDLGMSLTSNILRLVGTEVLLVHLALAWFITGWYLRQKRRHFVYMCWLFLPGLFFTPIADKFPFYLNPLYLFLLLLCIACVALLSVNNKNRLVDYSDKQLIGNTSKPIFAGIIGLVYGAFTIITHTVLLINYFSNYSLIPNNQFPPSVMAIILAILTIVGGVYALKRKRWTLSFAGSVSASFFLPFNLLGIIASVLLWKSANEFK